MQGQGRVILVGGEKGGTGKTTLAVNLAVMRALQGRDVLLVDTDSQASAAMWAQIRAEDKIEPSMTCVRVTGKAVMGEVNKLRPRFDDVVIDAGGRDSVELRSAMLVANRIVIPVKPSQFDLHSFEATQQIVELARTNNPGLAALVVVNMAPTSNKNRDAERLRDAITDMEGFTLGQTTIHNRTAYSRCAGEGRAVVEQPRPDSKAVAELVAIFHEAFA